MMRLDRALYFILKVASRLSFFQSHVGTSPVRSFWRNSASDVSRALAVRARALSRTCVSSSAIRLLSDADCCLTDMNTPSWWSLVASDSTSMDLESAAIAFSISSFAFRKSSCSCSRMAFEFSMSALMPLSSAVRSCLSEVSSTRPASKSSMYASSSVILASASAFDCFLELMTVVAQHTYFSYKSSSLFSSISTFVARPFINSTARVMGLIA
mmetsp:Transcript_42498/g.77124  ORF Transcript_42498/g.77124 Transcript_42498/m.77124 type:complete len:213 (-) Transcript_42498:111-749(-)